MLFQPFEQKDVDLYTCIAKDSNGNSANQSIGLTYDLGFMKISQRELHKRPRIVEIYQYGEKLPGHRLEFNCISEELDLHKTWLFNGNLLKQDKCGKLVINQFSSVNQGVYECVVSSNYGLGQKYIELTLPSQVNTTNTPTTTVKPLVTSKHTARIIVLSNTETDHVENGRVMLKCTSGESKNSRLFKKLRKWYFKNRNPSF